MLQDDIYDSEESLSSSSSENDLFENVEKITIEPKKAAKRKSILISVPREIVNMDEEDDGQEESKSQDNNQTSYNPDMFNLND